MSERVYWSAHCGETYVGREGLTLYVSADCHAGYGSLDLSEPEGLQAAIETRDLLNVMIAEASA